MEEKWVGNIKISLDEYDGAQYLNIRKYFYDRTTKEKKPGKGITLSKIEEIDEILKIVSDNREDIKKWVEK